MQVSAPRLNLPFPTKVAGTPYSVLSELERIQGNYVRRPGAYHLTYRVSSTYT
jgi:hypothetical protein